MTGYVLRLKDREGREGYFFASSSDESGQWCPHVVPDQYRAQKWQMEEQAEQVRAEFVSQQNMNPVEIAVEMIAFDQEFALVLEADDEGNPVDHISLIQQNGARLLVIGDAGDESSDELPDEVADLLVRVLNKIRVRLDKSA